MNYVEENNALKEALRELTLQLDAAKHDTGYTASDMASAAAQGFRDGLQAATIAVEAEMARAIELGGMNAVHILHAKLREAGAALKED